MKMVLTNEIENVVIRNGSDVVSFQSFEECEKYTGYLFREAGALTYEPLRNIHSFFDGTTTESRAVLDTALDSLIDNVQEYIQRKENPVYGLSGEELFNKQKDLDEYSVRLNYHSEKNAPVQVTVAEGTFSFNGGEGSAIAINSAVTLAQSLGEPDVWLWDIDNYTHQFSFASAINIATTIGRSYRDAAFRKQMSLVDITSRTYEMEG